MKGQMDRYKLNYLIDIGLLVFGTATTITGIMKLEQFRYESRLVTEIHDVTGVLFAIFALPHIYLHLKWMIDATKRHLTGNGAGAAG